MEEYIISEINCELKIIRPILQEINKVINADNNIYLEGKEKVFDFPEFNNVEVARNVLKILDTNELVLSVLNSTNEKNINVYIGNENEYDELKNLSIITFKNSLDEKDLGTIGIIGPTRMDYSKVISVMKYIKKILDNRWEQMDKD